MEPEKFSFLRRLMIAALVFLLDAVSFVWVARRIPDPRQIGKIWYIICWIAAGICFALSVGLFVSFALVRQRFQKFPDVDAMKLLGCDVDSGRRCFDAVMNEMSGVSVGLAVESVVLSRAIRAADRPKYVSPAICLASVMIFLFLQVSELICHFKNCRKNRRKVHPEPPAALATIASPPNG